ncbi:helicase [Sinorhizobium meliloti]|uniref:helicase n=1 Tax=Rhizobium meliloti TaxID=382 RepID=UPI0004A4C6B7|nr:helicase [Sinorhizobium meliloti]ARS71074.1 helicase [Sinorhizobium meliloti RU11/001]
MTDIQTARAEIIHHASALLLGPLSNDERLTSAPVDTYLTGILWPEGETLDAIEDDQSEGAQSGDDREADDGVPGYRAIRPCSFGITFAVDLETPLEISLGTTARYRAVEGEPTRLGARPARLWQRIPLGYYLIIPPGPASTWRTSCFLNAVGEQVTDPEVELHIRRRIDGEQQVLTVTLINKSLEADDRYRDELCLFQTEVIIRAPGKISGGAIRPRPVVAPNGGDEDAQSAALLYRDAVEFAVGHGVSVDWASADGRRADEVRTTWLPSAVVRGMSPNGHPLLGGFRERHPNAFNAAWLAQGDRREDVIAALRDFAEGYRNWIATFLHVRLGEFAGELQQAALRNHDRCVETARRIERGIRILETSDQAWTAFNLANAAMDRQSLYDIKGDRKGPLRWRPFQLAYILLVLPDLACPDDPEGDRECVDLLWFPTGGGKTEAYLALTAFQIFHRRLTDAGRQAHGGVDVLMRYTLRLLTVQQFQRAASLICACEAIRLERGDLGTASISLGLYVGGEATPNRIEEARTALAEEHGGQNPRSTPRQLLVCPVCGTDLPPSAYKFSDKGNGIDIRCSNPTCETAGRCLPVLTVDDFIYAEPPSLVIGTIDKFAQLPRRRDIRALFGLDGGLRPGLIIQDELHLISGPLGSVAGLYETVIDMLCTTGGVRPKVIGSTATIGQAARQVRALFDRSVLQFPPSGFEAGDSFFAVREEGNEPDRLYLGVCSAGRSPKFALQAAAAALLQVPEYLRSQGSAETALDPFWTCVLYFNSLRELGGAYVLLQDDVPRQMEFIATRLAGASGTMRALQREPVELSSRVPSRELPAKLNALAVPLVTNNDPYAELPEDSVLASNMISVGVDVSRLGLMVVNGQPKSTAEYIQASSRVGRGLHGLVVTLYNFGRPRDVSHFEHFPGYHAALYRSVEATSVTPWAPRARDKALHAVLAAAVRHLVDDMDEDAAATDFHADDDEVRAIIEAICVRAASASDNIEGAAAAADLEAIVREWAQRSQDARSSGRRLAYWEKKAPYGRTLPHLMMSAEEGGRGTGLAWPTPNSMREVEPSTAFSLKLGGI